MFWFHQFITFLTKKLCLPDAPVFCAEEEAAPAGLSRPGRSVWPQPGPGLSRGAPTWQRRCYWSGGGQLPRPHSTGSELPGPLSEPATPKLYERLLIATVLYANVKRFNNSWGMQFKINIGWLKLVSKRYSKGTRLLFSSIWNKSQMNTKNILNIIRGSLLTF